MIPIKILNENFHDQLVKENEMMAWHILQNAQLERSWSSNSGLNEKWKVGALMLKRKSCTSACYLRHNLILNEILNINTVFLQKRQHGV
jgi:hypothetical protein